jgi:hypothetical protein
MSEFGEREKIGDAKEFELIVKENGSSFVKCSEKLTGGVKGSARIHRPG